MNAQLSPDRIGLPPPRELDLIDRDRIVGWVNGNVVGFRGFGSNVEAAHAAWVAYRTLARRLARRDGRRPVPIDTEPLALQWRGDEEVILATGRAIGTLLRPGAESRSGPDSFGFEIEIPAPADELTVRAKAYLMYWTLRKSGIRWAMWTRDARRPLRRAEVAQAGGSRGLLATSLADNGADHDSPSGGTSDVSQRLSPRSWRIPTLPWRRAGRLDRGQRGRVSGLRER
jgi:hypothetical protein